MVLLGGLELVAAGYLVHRHQKNKRERRRLEEEEMEIVQEERERHHHHRERRSHSKRDHTVRPQNPPNYSQSQAQKHTYSAVPPSQQLHPQPLHSAGPVMSGTNARIPEQTFPPTGWPKEWEASSMEDSSSRPPTYRSSRDFHDSQSRRYAMSNPDLSHGYHSNTGLSDDDFDHLSMNGLEVYDPDRPVSPRVRFALPPGPQPGDERHEPPPPYRA